MNRKTAACTLLLALAALPAAAQRLEARRPNILLVIADDWSYPHAGIYGDRTVRTPNVDRLAREGARFTHAFAAAPSAHLRGPRS
jgi:hypothetical protein